MEVPYQPPIQTRPDNGGSWFEIPQDPNTFITSTLAAAVPTVQPTGLADETPPKGKTPWLYVSVACIIVIVLLLISMCIMVVRRREIDRMQQSRREASRRMSIIMRDNEEQRRDEEEGGR